MKEYEIALEVEGPMAMFTRPDTGSTPISYPVPTYSATKGMFESVDRLPWIYIHPIRVEVCRPIRYERYVTNYGGPLRKADQIKKDNNYQLFATVLVDVSYRLYAEVYNKKATLGRRRAKTRERHGKVRDWRPKFKAFFDERLAKGKSFYTPCLGWKEFVPRYFGPLRDGTRPDETINLNIPALLHSMWEHGNLKPAFKQDWEIVNGVMSYKHRRPDHVE